MIKPINRRSFFFFTSVNFFFCLKKAIFCPLFLLTKKWSALSTNYVRKTYSGGYAIGSFQSFFFSQMCWKKVDLLSFICFIWFICSVSSVYCSKCACLFMFCATLSFPVVIFIIGVTFFERWFSTEKKKKDLQKEI